jgi:hypothetical protein
MPIAAILKAVDRLEAGRDLAVADARACRMMGREKAMSFIASSVFYDLFTNKLGYRSASSQTDVGYLATQVQDARAGRCATLLPRSAPASRSTCHTCSWQRAPRAHQSLVVIEPAPRFPSWRGWLHHAQRQHQDEVGTIIHCIKTVVVDSRQLFLDSARQSPGHFYC